MNAIKRRLKLLRLTKGLTMAEFAQRIDVSPGNVGDWESESRSSVPGAKALIAISQAFDVSLDWILLGAGEEMEAAPASPSKWEKNSLPPSEAEQSDEPAVRSILAILPRLSREDRQLLLQLAVRLQDKT